jgi:RNA polymerase sigma factor (sigma-70 family)
VHSRPNRGRPTQVTGTGDVRFPVFDLPRLTGKRGEAERNSEWDRVFSHFQPRLRAYFGPRADGIQPLEELLDEVWLRAVLHIDSLESSGALWSWLVTVGNNLLRDALRRRDTGIELVNVDVDDRRSSDVAAFLGAVVPPDSPAATGAVERIRQNVSAEEWEFLNLLCVDNLSHESVATRLGLKSAAASRQRLRRIRQRLIDDDASRDALH